MTQEKFNWMDAVKILGAFLAFGVGWFADNQVTMVAFAASALVWLLSWSATLSPKITWLRGKGPLTVAVFVVSFFLAYLFQPFTLSAPPAWSGDVGSYFPLFSVWLSGILDIVGAAVVFAMSIYNLLLAQVYEKAGDVLTHLLGAKS